MQQSRKKMLPQRESEMGEKVTIVAEKRKSSGCKGSGDE
jgi:hypothetical protein